MTRLYILLPLVCATGATATYATVRQGAAPGLPAAVVAPGAATASSLGQSDQVGWVARYGFYNVRRGSWNLIPVRQGSRNLIPAGNAADEGC